MRLQKSFRLALNILIHSKLRSWLTIIGIVIGVAAIVAIVSIGEGAQASVQQRLGGLGADIITVSPGFQRAAGGFRLGGGERPPPPTGGKGKNLTLKDIPTIRSIDGIAFINGIVSGKADMTYLARTASVSVQGVDLLAWKNIVTTELEAGRYLNPGDTNVVVVGNKLAKSHFKEQLALNRMVTIEDKPFKIVGILKQSGGPGGSDNTVFMPIQLARGTLKKGDDIFDSITLKVENPDIVDKVTNDTETKLMLSRHVTDKTKDFSVTSAKEIQETITGVTQTFTLFLGAIAAVSLIVGAVGIANTMFTAVLEKTKEIGIMKAIGATNLDIMLIFLFNSGLVGLVGGLIGIFFGSIISIFLPQLLSGFSIPGGKISTVLPPWLLISALFISICIGMIAGAVPAYRASKLKPVDALRYE
ncbi:ABC transporter permease [Candidatus Woesearchaeota archaeon]|nr:ABC transporter permease [Candidatus Woesearchaeota archaeon]